VYILCERKDISVMGVAPAGVGRDKTSPIGEYGWVADVFLVVLGEFNFRFTKDDGCEADWAD